MNRDARKNVNHVFPVLASMHLRLDELTDKSLNRRELFSEIALHVVTIELQISCDFTITGKYRLCFRDVYF